MGTLQVPPTTNMATTITKEEAVKRLKEIHDYYSKGVHAQTDEEYDEFFAMIRERESLKWRFALDNQGNEL